MHQSVREKLAEAELLKWSPRHPREDRLMTLDAGTVIANPDLSQHDITAELECIARAHAAWRASVSSLIGEVVAGPRTPSQPR